MYAVGPEQVPSTVDVAVPVEFVQSGKPFCPQSHPNVLFPHGDGMGNYKQRERCIKVTVYYYYLSFEKQFVA